MDGSKRVTSENPASAEESKDSKDIIKLISEFVIAQDIVTMTNDWRLNFIRGRLKDSKFNFFYFKSVFLKIVTGLLIVMLFIIISDKYKKGKNHQLHEIKEKSSPVENIQNPESNEVEKEVRDESMAQQTNQSETNIQKNTLKDKKQLSMNLKAAIALMPSPVFIRIRHENENSLSEKIFNMYQNEDLDALIGVRNELAKKHVRSEYVEDLTGRLYLKKGNIDKAVEIYADLSQIDSPNVEEYEYMLLLAYYAGHSKHNFFRLKEYISSDSLHPYNYTAGKLYLSN